MINLERIAFNRTFTIEKYNKAKLLVDANFVKIPYRIAETPVFIPKELEEKLISAGNDVLKVILSSDFKEKTEKSIPAQWHIPHENAHPHFICLDFGLCIGDDGSTIPMLIELQGFPSLYGFQPYLAQKYTEAYQIDEHFSPFMSNFDEESYWALLKKIILGKHLPEEVILMDTDILNQKTAIDFHITKDKLGLELLAFEDLKKEGDQLYYIKNGNKCLVKRIYNRLIFDEIAQHERLIAHAEILKSPLNVEWATHPNWFYRISKFALPLISSPYNPPAFYLNSKECTNLDLKDYVLKPLFSFAGRGVKIEVTKKDIEEIKDPENWILQKKVDYAPVVASPDGGVKAEIRLMYAWADGETPQLCMNMVRLSRGEMVGVNYNKAFNWVGGSVGLVSKT